MNSADSGLPPASRRWPHSPLHMLAGGGAYIVTAGTYLKFPYLNSPGRLDMTLDKLFLCAEKFGWDLQAWAVMSNHYHFVAIPPLDPSSLRRFIGKMHMSVAKEINLSDGQPGRKIWFQYWESRITYQTSYLARLKYVHQNPVHHGVVGRAVDYPWCSAAWFERGCSPAFLKSLERFKIDRVNVSDAY